MIGIIFLLNIRYAPYLKKYTDVLEAQNQDFEIIYWDRLNSEDNTDGIPTKVFNYSSDLNKSKISKLKDFYKYRQFIVKNIKSNKYEKLIILTTLTGVLLTDLLLKDYKGKYVLDIRDYSFERNVLYKKLIGKLVENSYFTAISSKGFLNFLPQSNKYIIAHNYRDEDIEQRNMQKKTSKPKQIKISFLGSIRHFDLDKKIIEIFKDDNRFIIEYVGDGPHFEKLKSYVLKNHYKVVLPGRYNFNEKPRILSSVDIINGYYDEKEYINKYAISNKFYDSIIFKIPILVNKDVYLGEIVDQKYLGLAINIDNYSKHELSEIVHEKISNFDYVKFYKMCDELLQEIIIEDNLFKEKLAVFAGI